MEGVLFAYFAIVGSQIREGNWISILLEFTCLVDVNLVALFLGCYPAVGQNVG